MVTEVIAVKYQDEIAGALSYDTEHGYAEFEYEKSFVKKGIELSPLRMPLSANKIYAFPSLSATSFHGLPGLVSDSLPDDFGNSVLNAWLALQGRDVNSITPLERLQYIGTRGMGALEYAPATRKKGLNSLQNLQLDSLLQAAQEVLNSRNNFHLNIKNADKSVMTELLSVGTSAGGARPKAVLAFNKDFTEVRSGQSRTPEGFEQYLLKFDGVRYGSSSGEVFGDPMNFGVMEYIYYLMATKAGVEMMPCYLLEEGNRRHFLTKRFDRSGNNKIHIQTLAALDHVDFQKTATYSYEQAFMLLRNLGLDATAAEQLFRRMVFNVLARNHDDHPKNFAFRLSDDSWSLAPAYDLAYSYKPGSIWVNEHWMPLNSKRDGFTLADFYSFESISPLFSRVKIREIISQVQDALADWRSLAKKHELPDTFATHVERNFRSI